MSEDDYTRCEARRRAQLRIDRCQRVLRALAGRLDEPKAKRVWRSTTERYWRAIGTIEELRERHA